MLCFGVIISKVMMGTCDHSANNRQGYIIGSGTIPMKQPWMICVKYVGTILQQNTKKWEPCDVLYYAFQEWKHTSHVEPVYYHGLTEIGACISNYTRYYISDAIANPLPNFNSAAVEVRAQMKVVTSHSFTWMLFITHGFFLKLVWITFVRKRDPWCFAVV